jgi:molecular chaperone GrpE
MVSKKEQETIKEEEVVETPEIEIVDTKKPTPEEQIAQLEKEKAEIKDKWLRTAAEFDNFRRRTNSEKSDWIKNANQRLVLELCDVNDNFERALANEGSTADPASYKKGIELIHKQIDTILKREGVEKIKSDGKNFDPTFHDALAHIPSELKENVIAAVIQNGYTMNGKVIRAARVAVANGEKPVAVEKPEKKNKKKKK